MAARAVRRLTEAGEPWKLGVVCGRAYPEARMREWLEETLPAEASWWLAADSAPKAP